MGEQLSQETQYESTYSAPYKFRPFIYDANTGYTTSGGPQERRLRIEYNSGKRRNVKTKYFKLAMFAVVYCVYIYIVWKVNTGQGDPDKNATYWKRWAYLQGRKYAHKVAYRADVFDLTCKDRYEKLTEHAWLA